MAESVLEELPDLIVLVRREGTVISCGGGGGVGTLGCANGASAAALRRVPAMAPVVEMRAALSRAAKRGIANAARMPRIVITTTNSIRVKPRCSVRILIVLINRLSGTLSCR